MIKVILWRFSSTILACTTVTILASFRNLETAEYKKAILNRISSARNNRQGKEHVNDSLRETIPPILSHLFLFVILLRKKVVRLAKKGTVVPLFLPEKLFRICWFRSSLDWKIPKLNRFFLTATLLKKVNIIRFHDKLHKPNIPMRPIVSFCGSPTYQLSKYLTNVLKPLTDESRHKLQSTENFIDAIKTIQIPDDHKLVSFDVKSLFTSIPLQLAL